MLVQISEIKINTGRREAKEGDIRELANSISEVGLLNPITVDCGHTLIAGLHRLEAAKLLAFLPYRKVRHQTDMEAERCQRRSFEEAK